jgi:hypothetical protein
MLPPPVFLLRIALVLALVLLVLLPLLLRQTAR